MKHRSKNRAAINATATEAASTLTAFAFICFVLIVLLKYILYENGFSLYNNMFLLISTFCVRFCLISAEKSIRTHEKVCLCLFILYDKDLLDFFNVFLLTGVECIRQQMQQSIQTKEIVTFAIGLIFLLMGWNSVGRILVIYNFTMLLFMTLLFIMIMVKTMIYYFFSITIE